MTTAAVVQGRMGSTRLPGKVMMDIAGRPMIDRVLDRARRVPGVDRVIVATSQESCEAPLVEHCRRRGVPIHRGPESDVLARYVGAADEFGVDTVVRITSDCPLLMPEVSGRVVERFRTDDCDYASNTLERTYPRGLDTEVVSTLVLRKANCQASEPEEREHVTPYIYRNPDSFKLCSVTAEEDRSELRWTVDQKADLELIRRIYELLPTPTAGYEDLLSLISAHPELREMNSQVQQKSPELRAPKSPGS